MAARGGSWEREGDEEDGTRELCKGQNPRTARFPLLWQSAKMTGLNDWQFVCFHLHCGSLSCSRRPRARADAELRTQVAHASNFRRPRGVPSGGLLEVTGP
ncbi:hypothetical protein BaRGS_00035786 [Batillaria attramentaria]|uniref:Uncharacterized protein n=1 Tax=Batillaria attramentaria TaxID=370345 RepID=A0ABD0JDK5_9CAEN